MATPCPNSATIRFPAVTVPLKEVTNPLQPDVLCGRGGAAQRHAGNLHYRTLVNSNKPYYCTCPKPEKLRISKSIVAAVRESNGRFLERALDGLFYDIGDKKAVEKTSQALREGQPKLRRRLQDLQLESGAAGLPDAVVVDGIVESNPNALCSTAAVGDLDTNVQAAAAGYRSPLLGEGGIAAAVFVPEGAAAATGTEAGGGGGGGSGSRRASSADHASASGVRGQAGVVSAEQAYGTLPKAPKAPVTTTMTASASGTGDPPAHLHLAAQAMAQAQAQYHPDSVQRTPSGTPYMMVGGTAGSGGTKGGGGGAGGMELSKDSLRNLQAEAAAGTYGTVPMQQQQQQQQAQMQLYQQQLELKRRQEELREQRRQYEEKERARMIGQYQMGVQDLEPTPIDNMSGSGGTNVAAVGVGNSIGKGSGLQIDIGTLPTNSGNGTTAAVADGMFADISPIALPHHRHQRDTTLRTGNHGRPPSFKTRSIAEEIQYQQEELKRMQEAAQAQQLQLQQEQQQYYQQQQQQQQQLAAQPNRPGQTQQTSNNALSQISLMSTFSAIGDSAMSLGMLISDREVGVAGVGPAQAANSPNALAAAARAQAPHGSLVQQASPAVAAMASAAARPMTAETVSHVHPNPNAGPVSIWDAGESNRDLATLVADNTSIAKEKIMGYMADDHPEPQPESVAMAAGMHYSEPLQPERKGRRQIRRNSSVESRRQIFASMKRPVEQPRRPSTVEADSGNTMSSVSSETLGSKQKTTSAKASSDSGSDVWRSAEIKAAATAAAAAGGSPAAAGGNSGSKASVMSAEMDERSNADISKASGLSMMSTISDLGSQFSLLDFEMDRSTAAGLMSSVQVGQALANAGFGTQATSMESMQQPSQPQSHPPDQSASQQHSQEEMEASQYLVSVSEGLLDASSPGRKSSIK